MNEFLLRDDRLAGPTGRPVRGFPWWMHEVTPQMWLMLHTGWQLTKVLSKLEAICCLEMGVECIKDDSVLDEIPGAYKPIDEVMANQADLVDIVHTLKQVLCVKGA